MRVVLDTNVLLSNLYSATAPTSAAGLLLQTALSERFTLLFVPGVADEVRQTLATRPDLAARIPRADAEAFLTALETVAEILPRLSGPLPEIGRDRKDDLLIAHGVVFHADYLVTWDRELLNPEEIEGMRIVTPAALLHILRDAELLE
jgi:putative PIN family toxin of toxin-antitoxin system